MARAVVAYDKELPEISGGFHGRDHLSILSKTKPLLLVGGSRRGVERASYCLCQKSGSRSMSGERRDIQAHRTSHDDFSNTGSMKITR